MPDLVKIQLEWTYLPKDFFAYKITKEGLGYIIQFENGSVLGEIDNLKVNFNEEISENLTRLVNIELQAVQIQTGSKYELRGPAKSEIFSDGKINQIISLKPIILEIKVGKPTIYTSDENGNLINEGLSRLQQEQNLISKKIFENKDDETLQFLLDCYKKSLEKPEDTFINAFNMREALIKIFPKRRDPRVELGISKEIWKFVGEFPNDEPIHESRHRGRYVKNLRHASEREIEEAKEMEKLLIEKYLDYLDNKKNSTAVK